MEASHLSWASIDPHPSAEAVLSCLSRGRDRRLKCSMAGDWRPELGQISLELASIASQRG